MNGLFSAIARRDPSKRQIKPVNNEQLSLFDELDDDSDSEYVCEEKDDDDSESDDTDGGSTAVHDSSNSVSSNSTNELSTSRMLDNDRLESTEEAVKERKTKNESQNYLVNASGDGLSALDSQLPAGTQVTKDVDILICMLCLSDYSDPNDELIECDGCGIVVHEDCYKVVDSIFLSSGASSSSTDAWFCEPCLAGVKSPVVFTCCHLLYV